MVIGKKLFLNLDVTVFWLSYTFFLWQEWNECVAKVLGVSDDAGCFFEATTPVDSFNGGDVSTHDGLGSVHYFLQSSSFLGIQVAEPGCETTSQYALHCAAVEVQESICWHTHYQGVIWQYIQITIPCIWGCKPKDHAWTAKFKIQVSILKNTQQTFPLSQYNLNGIYKHGTILTNWISATNRIRFSLV